MSIPVKVDTGFFDKLLISGMTREELRKTEIKIGDKDLEITRMKNKQIRNVLQKISEQEWDDLSFDKLALLIYEVLPLAVGISQDAFDELPVEYNEAILIRFLESNNYFLLILLRMGIYQQIKAVLLSFSDQTNDNSNDKELDSEEKPEKQPGTSSNSEVLRLSEKPSNNSA